MQLTRPSRKSLFVAAKPDGVLVTNAYQIADLFFVHRRAKMNGLYILITMAGVRHILLPYYSYWHRGSGYAY